VEQAGQHGTEPMVIFARITWIRDLEQDPRIIGGPLDLAKVMGAGADKYGRCDLTIKQIQSRLVLRQEDGGYIPERTIKSWRTKLKNLGVMVPEKGGVGPGFAGPGAGRGGVWQLLINGQLNGQHNPLKTPQETGNGVAHSTITPQLVPKGLKGPVVQSYESYEERAEDLVSPKGDHGEFSAYSRAPRDNQTTTTKPTTPKKPLPWAPEALEREERERQAMESA
jgi:hypothetical protein